MKNDVFCTPLVPRSSPHEAPHSLFKLVLSCSSPGFVFCVLNILPVTLRSWQKVAFWVLPPDTLCLSGSISVFSKFLTCNRTELCTGGFFRKAIRLIYRKRLKIVVKFYEISGYWIGRSSRFLLWTSSVLLLIRNQVLFRTQTLQIHDILLHDANYFCDNFAFNRCLFYRVI